MRRPVLILALLSGPALAQPAHLGLVFGKDSLSAGSQDIRSLQRIDEKGRGSALVIQLVPAFDTPLRLFTSSHVGETGVLLICGQTVLEPQLQAAIPTATFVISDTDPARIDRLQDLLSSASCDPVPDS